MRQGQQHRRGRNRSSGASSSHHHHQRKSQNPLARSFESNGPDVKVRGTAADIAGKYLALARDAQSSGDPVLAENYMQHAEHYNRMIIAYREQQSQFSGEGANGSAPRPRGPMSPGDEMEDGEPGEVNVAGGEQPQVAPRAQHYVEGQQTRGEYQQREPRGEHHRGEDRRPSHRGEQRPDSRGEHRYRDRRPDRGDRPDRQERGEPHGDVRRAPREPVGEQPQPVVDAPPVPGRDEPLPRRKDRERVGMGEDQPDFLRRPVRRPRSEDGGSTRGEGSGREAQRSAEADEKAVD
jgi:hypothetical protein